MQKRLVKSLFSQSLRRQINDKMKLKPNTASSAGISHVRSLRSNVRKASKIFYSLYPLYSYTTIFDLNSAKKLVLNPNIKQIFKKWRSIAIFGHFAKGIVIYSRDPNKAIHFIPTNMVRTRVGGNLRMRKQNTKTTVPLDVVPERRTKRFPPRFRPVGRFCELRFRYLSSPISRPLDHMRQIPFIHSARLIDSTNFCIYSTIF